MNTQTIETTAHDFNGITIRTITDPHYGLMFAIADIGKALKRTGLGAYLSGRETVYGFNIIGKNGNPRQIYFTDLEGAYFSAIGTEPRDDFEAWLETNFGKDPYVSKYSY